MRWAFFSSELDEKIQYVMSVCEFHDMSVIFERAQLLSLWCRSLTWHMNGRFCYWNWLFFPSASVSNRYYSATILQMSGVRDDRLAIWLAGLTTLTNFLFTLLGVWLVERVGRRKLTLGSIIGKQVQLSSSGSDVHRHLWSVFNVACVMFFLDRYEFESGPVGHRFSDVGPAQPSCHLSPAGPIYGQLHLLQIPVSANLKGSFGYKVKLAPLL